uniref:Uncharacterized protein n=1 Tax=viral metagenome TaxID=1070528 RepID=A0A6M3JM76_9ZZZZ
MVRLLRTQQDTVDAELTRLGQKELEQFAIFLLVRLLEIFESDLTTEEEFEIKGIVQEWIR